MNNLFGQSDVSQILERIEKLTPGSQRQWGKMNVAQMLAGKNSPTDKSYIFKDVLKFEEENQQRQQRSKSFFEGGPSQCTIHPHPFFGKFTPEEWAIFQ